MDRTNQPSGPGPVRFFVLAVLLGPYLIVTLVFAFAAKRWSRRRGVNARWRREQALIGREGRFTGMNEAGIGNIRLNDAWWIAITEQSEPASDGCLVEVVDTNGATLIVRPTGT